MISQTSFPETSPEDHDDILNSPERLAALRAAKLMDTPPEEAYDRAVRLATKITGVPVGLLSLVDGQRQFFKAQVGLAPPMDEERQTPLSHSFCQYVVTSGQALSVQDAREHPMLRENLAVPDLDVVAYLGVPVCDAHGRPLGSFCAISNEPHEWSQEDLNTLRDLSAMLETEIAMRQVIAERQLLLDELNHRLKNLFTIVSGFVRMNRREHKTVDELANSLESRIRALAQAHELIVPVVTANQQFVPEVSLQKLVATILDPHLDRDVERVTIDGPLFSLGAKTTTNLALALHELATNAAKYGALSDGDGVLKISWKIDEQHLQVDWHESMSSGALTYDVQQSGFGSKLLRLSIEAQLGGIVETNFSEGALHRKMRIPIEYLNS